VKLRHTKRRQSEPKQSKTACGEAQQWKAKANGVRAQVELPWNMDQHRNGLAEQSNEMPLSFGQS